MSQHDPTGPVMRHAATPAATGLLGADPAVTAGPLPQFGEPLRARGLSGRRLEATSATLIITLRKTHARAVGVDPTRHIPLEALAAVLIHQPRFAPPFCTVVLAGEEDEVPTTYWAASNHPNALIIPRRQLPQFTAIAKFVAGRRSAAPLPSPPPPIAPPRLSPTGPADDPGGVPTPQPTSARQPGPAHRADELDLYPALRQPVRTWQDAEQLGFILLAALGFGDARVTGAGSDGGLDAVATGAACQVKHWNGTVGRPEVQRLAGAARTAQAVFLSASGYTPKAVAWANLAGVALFVYDETATVRPVNPAATTLAASNILAPLTAREQALTQRLDQASRQLAFLAAEIDQRRSRPGLRRTERWDLDTALKPFGAAAQILFGLDGLTRSRIAPLWRLDRRLRRAEKLLRSAARRARVGLPH